MAQRRAEDRLSHQGAQEPGKGISIIFAFESERHLISGVLKAAGMKGWSLTNQLAGL